MGIEHKLVEIQTEMPVGCLKKIHSERETTQCDIPALNICVLCVI